MDPSINIHDCTNMVEIVLNKSEDKYKVLEFLTKNVENNSDAKYVSLFIIITMFNEVKKLKLFVKICNDGCNVTASKELAVEKITEVIHKLQENDLRSSPKCFLYKNNVLIFEDFKLKGYQKLPASDGTILDLNHLKIALTRLSKFHAMSIIYEENSRKNDNKFYKLTDEFDIESVLDVSNEDLESLLDLIEFQEHDKAELSKIDMKEKFREEARELITASKQFMNVLCHGNLWRGNMLFKYENSTPVDCKFINFERGCYVPPAYDVLSLIYFSTDVETRKNHLDDLLMHYFNSLSDNLSNAEILMQDIMTYEEFFASCAIALPRVTLNVALNFNKITKRNLHDVNSMANIYSGYFVREMLQSLTESFLYPRFSRDDCNRILRYRLGNVNFQLLRYHLKPLNGSKGLCGDHIIITTVFTVEGTEHNLTFFGKFWPTNDFQAAFIAETGGFEKEIFIYDILLKRMTSYGINLLDTCIPRSYMARKRQVIVFDDLGSEGYVCLDKHKPADYELITVLVKSLAKMHASSLIFEELKSKELGRRCRINEEYENCFFETIYKEREAALGTVSWRASTKCVLKLIDYFGLDRSFKNGKSFKELVLENSNKVFDWVKPSKTYRNAVSHGDLWANNILVKYDQDGRPLNGMLVDFQVSD